MAACLLCFGRVGRVTGWFGESRRAPGGVDDRYGYFPSTEEHELAERVRCLFTGGLVACRGVGGPVPCGPDPQVQERALRTHIGTDCGEMFVPQIRPDADGFLDACADEAPPRLLGG